MRYNGRDIPPQQTWKGGAVMLIDPKSIRHYRLCAHHLDKKIPPESILEAAGACGLQNSPPGAWETALFNRLEGCPLQELRESLYAVSYTHLRPMAFPSLSYSHFFLFFSILLSRSRSLFSPITTMISPSWIKSSLRGDTCRLLPERMATTFMP